MGNIVRTGDLISCGDHAGQGSPDVTSNGMSIVTEDTNLTTGHGCFPPTKFQGPWSETVFVNGKRVALKGITQIIPHRCGKQTHGGVAIGSGADVLCETQ